MLWRDDAHVLYSSGFAIDFLWPLPADAMTPVSSFAFARVPEIHFGPGKLSSLPQHIARFGKNILLLTGDASFKRSAAWPRLVTALEHAGITAIRVSLRGEPSPAFVDATVERCRSERIDCVVGIGGGSVLDAGKAVAAMLPQEGSVIPYLECVDSLKHDGRKIPFIAVPTSSGTGSEATKNAVLSEIGSDGYKSSLRHDNFVPDMALIDPELMLGCPPDVTAACGLDTLTQLLEAYVSTKASPMTDALALDGLAHVARGFMAAYKNGSEYLAARADMAYAALLSGIVLANAGLGVVHGFAAPLGGFFPIPHGVVCGTLIGAATRINIETMRQNSGRYSAALEKYARAGAVLSGQPAALGVEAGCDALVRTLDGWIAVTGVARLSAYGVGHADLARILDRSNNKNSPVTLNRLQMESILETRL